MQELEKILEDIRGLEKILITDPIKLMVDMGEVEDIIRKHMNDGWIPVEERLPERTFDEKIKESYQKYLVFIDGVDGWDIDIAVYDFWNDKKWREAHDGYGEIENVIAWRPLPEPYRPERSDGE